ncbi:unnamed protein product [Oppiella nova]|uniref:Arrestin C-terminal-like domain-containing protein n=1 Tax=Oppiella nova TaxID=334625 RepID=A0A7R9MIQ6_9ACAR|nr:unnamed protein product [Oppiella nova]CAG2177991.1 unnamed protein product [Oppiella nova]
MGKIQLRDFQIVFNSKNGINESDWPGSSVMDKIKSSDDFQWSSTSSQVITKGIHEFPTIPSSFTAKQGSVKYWIEAKIDKSSSSFSRNHKTKAEFIVEAPIIVQNPMVTNKCVIIKGLLVGPGVTDMQTLLVPIPADIPLSIDCPIISVSYELHLTADIPLARDLHIDLPINITKFQLYEYGV